jgi:hypothetical protein
MEQRKTLMLDLNFFNALLVWPVPLAHVLPLFSTDFSFQNMVFWNLFEFPAAEITLKSMSPTF